MHTFARYLSKSFYLFKGCFLFSRRKKALYEGKETASLRPDRSGMAPQRRHSDSMKRIDHKNGIGMKTGINIFKHRISGSTLLLVFLLLLVWLVQLLPGWGNFYARSIYPLIAYPLSSFSRIFPFAIGDLFLSLIHI